MDKQSEVNNENEHEHEHDNNEMEDDRCTYEYGQGGHGSCFLCNTQIHGEGYVFVQSKEFYSRDYYFVACSAYSCPSGMRADNGICKSTCRKCARSYIHNRYDNDYCPECPGESIMAEYHRLEAEKAKLT
jgi:hypothetical protein